MKKSKLLNFLKIPTLFLAILIPANSYAMLQEDREDPFKIRFSTQNVMVRTSNEKYAESTWERAIPNQGLAEKSAKEGCKIDPSGMCCSHAVVCALEYCHNRTDLLASYLHKAVTGGYDKGMDLAEAMNFVKNNGVMALPPGQIVKHGSGLPWPNGQRYKFTGVINADDPHCLPSERAFSYPDKASRYEAILKRYNHPIVVTILSGYEGYPNLSPFLKYRNIDQDDMSIKITKVELQNGNVPSNTKKVYHAIILYGFRKSTECFFVKNSWGPDGKNGLCTLPYDYLNKFATSAFVGLGHEDWLGAGIMEGITAGPLEEEILKGVPDPKCLVQ
jgi:hypothetical protein